MFIQQTHCVTVLLCYQSGWEGDTAIQVKNTFKLFKPLFIADCLCVLGSLKLNEVKALSSF